MPIKIQRRLQEIKNAMTSAYAANQRALCKLLGIKNPKSHAEWDAYEAEIAKRKSGKINGTKLEIKNYKELAERGFLTELIKFNDGLLDKFGF